MPEEPFQNLRSFTTHEEKLVERTILQKPMHFFGFGNKWTKEETFFVS